MRFLSDFVCPFCKKSLNKESNHYFCDNGHSFDIAKEGYVHLLPVNKMHSKMPGDSKEMVLSRRRFLQSGYYNVFSDTLNEIVENYIKDGSLILDAGCGEGFYTKRLFDFLNYKYENVRISAFDISKYAVKYASKSDKNSEYAVASIFDIPVKNDSVDIVVNIFAPMVENEFCRVLKRNGILIFAVPSENHLWGLKKIAYKNPYRNEYKESDYEGFEFVRRIPVRDVIVINDSGLIDDLFTMTPYYWKTDVYGSSAVHSAEHLETEIGFDFIIYRKK